MTATIIAFPSEAIGILEDGMAWAVPLAVRIMRIEARITAAEEEEFAAVEAVMAGAA